MHAADEQGASALGKSCSAPDQPAAVVENHSSLNFVHSTLNFLEERWLIRPAQRQIAWPSAAKQAAAAPPPRRACRPSGKTTVLPDRRQVRGVSPLHAREAP